MLPFYVNKNQTPSTNKFHNIHSAEYFLHSQDDNLRPPLVEVSDPKKMLISDMIPMPIISTTRHFNNPVTPKFKNSKIGHKGPSV